MCVARLQEIPTSYIKFFKKKVLNAFKLFQRILTKKTFSFRNKTIAFFMPKIQRQISRFFPIKF